MPRFARALDAPLEILLEIVECKNMAVNEAPVESLLHQDFQVVQAEHRNGALPADPGITFGLRLHLHEGIAEESASQIPGALENALVKSNRRGDNSMRTNWDRT